MKEMEVADFFCGAGGFSEGFKHLGFNIVFALDNWKPAIETHNLNHPKCDSVLLDILELNSPEKIDEIVPDTEIIIGSPPCVSFSNSNRSGKSDKTLGLELIKVFLRVVAWKKKKGVLKYWIMENVPNSEKYTKDKYSWKELGLPGKGPSLELPTKKILNSADFGTSQSRKRFFSGDFPIPKKTHDKTNYLTIQDVFDCLGNPLAQKDKEICDPTYPLKIKSHKLSDHFYDNKIADFEWKKAKKLKRDHGYMGKMSFPEEVNRPCRTIMATMSASLRESIIFSSFDKKKKKDGYRRPTIREAACFMSFPIDYQFEAPGESSKYRLVGNAVCPKLSEVLAKAILLKEGKKPYLRLNKRDKIMVRNNLNGSKRKLKTFTPKKFESKFSEHVPELKVKNYRVSLENIKSNFENKEIIWNCVIHYGTGKDARKLESSNEKAKTLVEGVIGFKEFDKSLKRTFSKFNYNNFSLHEDFLNNPLNEGPEKILLEIRDLIDRDYPESKFGDYNLKHREKGFNIGNGTMPLRIGLALYACSLFISSFMKTGNQIILTK